VVACYSLIRIRSTLLILYLYFCTFSSYVTAIICSCATLRIPLRSTLLLLYAYFTHTYVTAVPRAASRRMHSFFTHPVLIRTLLYSYFTHTYVTAHTYLTAVPRAASHRMHAAHVLYYCAPTMRVCSAMPILYWYAGMLLLHYPRIVGAHSSRSRRG